MCSPSIRIAAETSLPLFFNNYRRTDNVAGGTKEGKKSGFLRAAATATAAAATATAAELGIIQGDQLCPLKNLKLDTVGQPGNPERVQMRHKNPPTPCRGSQVADGWF